jgi:NADPH-dependent curcumin reductase CurA
MSVSKESKRGPEAQAAPKSAEEPESKLERVQQLQRGKNSRWVLAKRPEGEKLTPDCFKLEAAPVPELKPGFVIVRSEWFSVDPSVRDQFIGSRIEILRSLAHSFCVLWARCFHGSACLCVARYLIGWEMKSRQPGEPMVSLCVGTIQESQHPRWKEGQHIAYYGKWELFSATDCGTETRMREVDVKNFEPQKYLGILGSVDQQGNVY